MPTVLRARVLTLALGAVCVFATGGAQLLLNGGVIAARLGNAAEQAFADSMAARDFDAFKSFLDPETVFGQGERVLRGADAVAAAWAGFFEGDAAPFSWKPETVTVLSSGDLGMTSGPVFDPEGTRVATFNSVWRRDAEGRFRVVFDRGCPKSP